MSSWPPFPAAAASARPIRPRNGLKAPLLTLVAVIVVLAGMVGGVLLVLSRQGSGLSGEPATPPALAAASPEASPVAGSPAVVAAPSAQVGASPAANAPAARSAATAAPGASGTPAAPAVAASPAAITTPPVRTTPTRAASPPRSSPVIVPTIPSLISPPGLRFPTNTPARIVATRTPPPVPTPRPASANTPLRVDRSTYQVGEEATVCAQASFGSSAQIGVLEPNGAQRTLGEFQPPADRVCQTLKLENPGIYVLTLTIKDGAGRELERHATVIVAAR